MISTDEMSGVQAKERKYPNLPLQPGKVERREYEYRRHGTICFITNFEVATGKVGHISSGPTRNEQDFCRHIQATIETDPSVEKWHFVVDNLNTHLSESLVKLVASESDIDETSLGIKGKSGILESKKTREAFLSNSDHRIVFYYTPKHASWMNQIEIWFSIVARKVLRRGNFKSVEDLVAKVMAFVDYYNATAAPFNWTSKGKALSV